MAEEHNLEQNEAPQKSRRDFVRTSAQVAITAPAVAMLLSASAKRALADTGDISAYQASSIGILDDFTFGNDREDIDSHVLGSNFNPLNGTPEQDDHV